MKANSITPTAASAAHAVASESAPLRFEIDPWWPKPLPEGWITGQLACVSVDHHDHVIVVNRGDITEEERETCIQAPAVMIFDVEGNMIDAWGDWAVLPATPHSCAVDNDNNDRNGNFLRQWAGGRRRTKWRPESAAFLCRSCIA